MTPKERYLVHQIHPAKLATDVGASLVSTVLLWRHRRLAGLAVLVVPAPVASALLLRGDLGRWRDTAAGRYVLGHMPSSMQALRVVSAVVTAVGGWQRRPGVLVCGHTLTVVGWSHGLLARRPPGRPS
jgi:hypothetical protein